MIGQLLTEAEAARQIGIKPRSLRTERYAGRISFKRVAGKIYYRSADLEEWQGGGCRRASGSRRHLG